MKVLVIEDNTDVIEFISIAFEIGWPDAEIISTHQGDSGVELAGSQMPDVVLLDIGLPDISGFNVLKQIRAFSEVPVIIQTVKDSEADIVRGLGLGADEYIVKPYGQMELLARVRSVLRRHNSHLSNTVSYGMLHLDTSSGQLSMGTGSVCLTRTETLILNDLIISAGHAVTFTRLAETVWGTEYPNAEPTLRVYIRRLRQKVEAVSGDSIRISSRAGIGYSLGYAR